MIRFLEADVKSINENVENSDYLIMGSDIWGQGRTWFKYHRNAEKILVKDKNGKIICYAFQDMDANRELRMLEELCDEKDALHFEDIYPEYDCVVIQECNELAYFFAKYLQSRGVPVKVSGKYWDQTGKWAVENATGRVLTIYAEGTWEHNQNLSYELLRSVSVEFEYIDHIYKENIKKGIITNAKCSYQELIGKLKNRNIILLGTGNTVQDIYDMLAAEGVDIAAFLSDGVKNGLRLLGKEIIGTGENEKYADTVFIEPGKNSALGQGYLEEYIYYGCRRNENYFLFGDYAEVQRNNLQHILRSRPILLAGERLLSDYIKQHMVSGGKEADSVQYYEEAEDGFINDNTVGVVVVLQMFGLANSFEKWKKEIDLCVQTLKEYKIRNYTLYFTMSSSFARIESNRKKYDSNELRPKGILLGAINAFSGNVFFRDCIDNHPDIIQFGFTPFENDMFWYCICCSQVPVDEVVSTLFSLHTRVFGEEWLLVIFPNPDVFREKCEAALKGKETVTPQELFVIFAIAYNEMMGRKIQDINQTYIYWEPHMQDIPLRLLYADWLAEEKTKSVVVYLTRNSLISLGSGLAYSYRTNQRISLVQMMSSLLNVPYILDIQESAVARVILRFEDLKLESKETWEKFCDKIGIPWSNTLLYTTRFGKESYYDNGAKRVTGYDLGPVYRDYADLFSPFDKMRICFCKAEYQRKYGYPYDNTSFTRKELQELFLREFKCRKALDVEENETDYILAHKYIRRRLNEIYANLFWDSLMGNDV